MPSRKASRSRSRKRARKPSPSPSSESSGESSSERSPVRAAPRKGATAEKAPARSGGAAAPAQPAAAATEELSLEGRLALLEIEIETLKAENRELRKKLLEALRRPAAAAPEAAASSRRHREPEPVAAPEPAGDRRRSRDRDDRKDRKDRKKAAEEPKERKRREPEATSSRDTEEPARRRKEPESAPTRDAEPERSEMHRNVIQLVDGQMEAYNEAIPNNIPLESRLPLVQSKLERFLSHFDEKVQIIDLKSGKAIIKDWKIFQQRYGCVFRESGSKLKGITQKRFYYDASGTRPTYVLDFEMHESLVTATPGTPQDGKLGVRDPRTENLAVLYEEKGGKITRLWLRPDTEKLGPDPYAGEDIITRHELFKAFEEKIAELKGGAAGPRIFHNYHNIPTVG